MTGVVTFASGLALGIYGLALFLYRGEGENDNTYVKLAGSSVDAQTVGLIALALAVAGIVLALLFLRRWSTSGECQT